LDRGPGTRDDRPGTRDYGTRDLRRRTTDNGPWTTDCTSGGVREGVAERPVSFLLGADEVALTQVFDVEGGVRHDYGLLTTDY